MSQTAKCPFCAEDILPAAIKCKHCGTALSGPSVEIRKQFVLSRPFRILGGLVVGIFVACWAYTFAGGSGSVFPATFNDQTIENIKNQIRQEYAERPHTTVSDVEMVKVSARRLEGFVEIRRPLIGAQKVSCSATLSEDGRQTLFNCK